jgi:hypothetical protein
MNETTKLLVTAIATAIVSLLGGGAIGFNQGDSHMRAGQQWVLLNNAMSERINDLEDRLDACMKGE